jgi:nicotinate-nucleotide pyrophosphorylase (carboxylating)
MSKQDIRDLIFLPVRSRKYLAAISVQEPGILSGIRELQKACKTMGIQLRNSKKDGERVRRSDIVAVIQGSAKQIALSEEQLMGWTSKSSGIATAAWKAKAYAGKNLKVVSGAWKKMPLPVKHLVRQAIVDGGLRYRIAEKPFLYLDKNYVQILGGIRKALLSTKGLRRFTVVIQLKGGGRKLLHEAKLAARLGAHIIMIDTGKQEDIKRVDLVLRKQGLRKDVKIAFGGNIQIEDLKSLKKMPVEIVDMGKAIVDAPLLDMKMDIVNGAGRKKDGTRTL